MGKILAAAFPCGALNSQTLKREYPSITAGPAANLQNSSKQFTPINRAVL